MTTMNISLPDELKAFVDAQVAAGGYSTASEYMRALLREAQKRTAQERLEALLLEGLESGDAQALTDADWEAIRREGRERLAARQSRKLK